MTGWALDPLRERLAAIEADLAMAHDILSGRAALPWGFSRDQVVAWARALSRERDELIAEIDRVAAIPSLGEEITKSTGVTATTIGRTALAAGEIVQSAAATLPWLLLIAGGIGVLWLLARR